MPLPPSRKRVSQACRNCSIRKIKCGGEFPRCSICILNQRDCSYGISKRNTRQHFDQASNTLRSPSSSDTQQQDKSSSRASHEISNSDSIGRTPPTLQVPVDLSVQLFQIYFSHVHSVWPVLYKPLFASISYHDLGKEFPQALVYSIYAISSCFQHKSTITSTSTHHTLHQDHNLQPSSFFDAALCELERAEGGKSLGFATALNPSIWRCQSFTILALQQHGVGEFSRAAVLCGIASSMAVDLRLHRDLWRDSPVEREVASRLWWNIYVLQNMISIEMSKPVHLRSEESDAPLPSIEESDEYEMFTPRGRQSASTRSSLSRKIRTISVFRTTIACIKIGEKMSREVYSLFARQALAQDREMADTIRMQIWAEFHDWEASMEASALSLDLSENLQSLPAVVANFMMMKTYTMLLHRPFISFWQETMTTSGRKPFNTPDPWEVCIRAAKDNCDILEKYHKYLPELPCDLVYSVFVTAATLHSVQVDDPDYEDSRRRLRLCESWLSIFRENWGNAGARQKLLVEYQAFVDSSSPVEGRSVGAPPEQRIQVRSPPGGNAQNIRSDQTRGDGTPYPVDESGSDWGFLYDLMGVSDDSFYAMDAEYRAALVQQVSEDVTTG